MIDGLKEGHIGSLALDVYEEEGPLFFEDRSSQIIQDDVFAEDAVTAYTDALADGDFDAVMRTFTTETYVANFDFEASLERLRVYQPFIGALPLPSTDPFNEAINIEQRRSTVAGMILNQYFTLANPELEITLAQPLADAEAVEARARRRCCSVPPPTT